MKAIINDPDNFYHGREVTLEDTGFEGVYMARMLTGGGASISFAVSITKLRFL